jgi:hypothetical protein
MYQPQLSVETEFDLMVTYQRTIESKSVIIENDLRDKERYSLYSVSKPFPTYEEFLNGNEFDEQELIMSSSSIDALQLVQDSRRTL